MKTRFLPLTASGPVVVGIRAGIPARMTMRVAGLAWIFGADLAVAADVPARTSVSATSPASAPYQQRAYLPEANLVTPEVAAAIQERFRAAYPKLGSPRFLLHVNRTLVDSRTGLRVVGRD